MKRFSGNSGFKKFAEYVGLSNKETDLYKKSLELSFMPFLVTKYFADLIKQQDEPYRTQLLNIVLPPIKDKKFIGRFDPYGNVTYRQGDAHFIQHKYKNTLLLHMDNYCISNCQFCYKVNEISKKNPPNIQDIENKVNVALKYIDQHPEINNILFTGGDPAAFIKTDLLVSSIEKLISHKNIRIIRFATKGLSYYPKRFLDKELLELFDNINSRKNKQISIIAQFNHPAEIAGEAIEALEKIQATGTQVRGQPAIIKGVNDSVETLIDLQRKFVDYKIISYYLTIFMPVRGVEQYAIQLHKIYENIANSKRNLSGLEKKGVVLASHDFGKFEIVGFYPNMKSPKKIILKWHEASMAEYLPLTLKEKINTQPEDVLILDYNLDSYCIDDVFRNNGLPYFNENNQLID